MILSNCLTWYDFNMYICMYSYMYVLFGGHVIWSSLGFVEWQKLLPADLSHLTQDYRIL